MVIMELIASTLGMDFENARRDIWKMTGSSDLTEAKKIRAVSQGTLRKRVVEIQGNLRIYFSGDRSPGTADVKEPSLPPDNHVDR